MCTGEHLNALVSRRLQVQASSPCKIGFYPCKHLKRVLETRDVDRNVRSFAISMAINSWTFGYRGSKQQQHSVHKCARLKVAGEAVLFRRKYFLSRLRGKGNLTKIVIANHVDYDVYGMTYRAS